jgi:hypothetical protein
MKKPFLLLAALALPLLGTTQAGATVNPALVSADAKWLVYADLNALRESALGKELIALGEKAQLDTGNGKLGIDWQKLLATVGSATAYGANVSPDPKEIDGTLVFQGTPDLRKIAEAVLIQANLAHPENVAELTDLPFPAYIVKETKAKSAKTDKEGEALRELANTKGAKTAEPQEVIIAFPPEPIVLVSKSKPHILKARDVFRGAAPSLAKSPGTPLAKFVQASEGAFLFAASTVPAESFLPKNADSQGPEARIFKMASAGSLALGEHGDSTFAHSELIASSDQMGEKLMKILQGMTAMMSLAETNDKQLAEFLNSAAVNRKGDVVTLDLAYSSARLATMVKSLVQTQSSAPDYTAPRTPQMLNGRSLAEWKAEPGPASADGAPGPVTVRQIDNVALKNGTLITLARQNNGGRNVRYDRIEILPAGGAGMPLTFRPESMRNAGTRGNWQQFQFPGVDGAYTLKIAYLNDPEGKAAFAVSAKDPKAPATEPEPTATHSPLIPQPKIK